MQTVSVQKASLRIVGLAGALAFVTFFSFTYSIPGWVEQFANAFIQREVAEQIDSRIDGFEPPAGDGALSRVAATLYRQNQQEIERLKGELKAGVHERMADALAEIRDLDCECRDKYAQTLQRGFELDIALLQAANDKVVDFIQATYMQVVAEVKRDIRVFTGSNAGVFLLLLLVSLLKPEAISHLFVPAALLSAAALICAYFYVFEQNWLLTIIYGHYFGFAYLAYLGLVFFFLCDIVLNRARVTTRLVNAVFEAAGSSVTWAPC